MSRNLNKTYHKNIEFYCKEVDCKFDITLKGTVYFFGEHGELRRANSLVMRSGRILINHEGWNITLTGFSKKKMEFTYEAKKEEPEDG